MPKRTFQPKKKRRIRRLGFLRRMRSNGGQNILKRKRAKGRKDLSVSDEMRADKNKKFSRRR